MDTSSGLGWLFSLPFLQMVIAIGLIKVFFSITKTKTKDDLKKLLKEIAILAIFVFFELTING